MKGRCLMFVDQMQPLQPPCSLSKGSKWGACKDVTAGSCAEYTYPEGRLGRCVISFVAGVAGQDQDSAV